MLWKQCLKDFNIHFGNKILMQGFSRNVVEKSKIQIWKFMIQYKVKSRFQRTKILTKKSKSVTEDKTHQDKKFICALFDKFINKNQIQ